VKAAPFLDRAANRRDVRHNIAIATAFTTTVATFIVASLSILTVIDELNFVRPDTFRPA